MERARYVLQVIDTARAAGIPEATINAEVAALRAETCDLEAVIAAARTCALSGPAWLGVAA